MISIFMSLWNVHANWFPVDGKVKFVNGKVIMYADNITDSMQKTIDETARRRSNQRLINVQKSLAVGEVIELHLTKDNPNPEL